MPEQKPLVQPKGKTTTHLGVTLQEIHSDEPHEAVDVRKAELYSRPIASLGSNARDPELFNVSKVFEDEHIERGMIVSDRKRERPSFFENIQLALKEWWGMTVGASFAEDELTQKRNARNREAMIEKEEAEAREKEAMRVETLVIPPQGDHHIIIEKIRTYKSDVAKIASTQSATATLHEPEAMVAEVAPTKVPTDLDLPPVRPDIKIAVPDLRENLVAPAVKVRAPEPEPPTPQTDEPVVVRKQLNLEPVAKEIFERSPEPLPKASPVVLQKQMDPTPIASEVFERPQVPLPVSPKPMPPTPAPVPPRPTPIHEDAVVSPIRAQKAEQTPGKSDSGWTYTTDQAPDTDLRIPDKLPPLKSDRAESDPLFAMDRDEEEEEKPTILPRYTAPRIVEPEPQESESVENEAELPREALVTPTIESAFRDFTAPQVPTAPLQETDLPEPVAEQPLAYNPPPIPVSQRARTSTPQSQNSGRLFPRPFIVIGGVVIVLVFVVGTGFLAMTYLGTNTSENVPTATTPDTTTPVIPNALSLGGNADEFLKNFEAQVESAPSGYTVFTPLIGTGEMSRRATSGEFLTFMKARLSGRTLRALDDTFTLGSITTTKNEPFIILRSYNFDILFSGLLAWETFLYDDFAPVFGSAPIANTHFKDAVRGNTSTRILYDADGKEILLYSFINQNTVIITTSGEALAKLIVEL